MLNHPFTWSKVNAVKGDGVCVGHERPVGDILHSAADTEVIWSSNPPAELGHRIIDILSVAKGTGLAEVGMSWVAGLQEREDFDEYYVIVYK
jgi:hypothetical protein